MPVCVAFVIDPAQTVLDGIGFEDGMRHVQQRPNQQRAVALRSCGGHPGRTGHAGPAQEVEQHRFGLIVAMVCQRYGVRVTGGKRRMAAATRGCLQPFAAPARDADTLDLQGHIHINAKIATELRPAIGVRAKTVMHMQGRQFRQTGARRVQAAQRVQQHHRIHPAGKGDDNAPHARLPGKKPGQGGVDGVRGGLRHGHRVLADQ